MIVSSAHGQEKITTSFARLADSHDLALSAWGPYSKHYAGISHLPDLSSGLRFDVTVVPGFYRSKSIIPNVLFESGYVPWDVDSRLTHVTYRYELEWKDRVFVDVTYTIVDEKTVLVEMRCVNQTALPQNLALNVMANLVYPNVVPEKQIQTSGSAFWVNATQYKSLELANKSPQYHLVPDGGLRGEVRGNEFIDGKAIGHGFGADAGDNAVYDLPIKEAQRHGILRLLYRMKDQLHGTFRVSGLINQTLPLSGTGNFETVDLPYSLDASQERILTLTSEGGAAIDLNGLMIVPEGEAQPQITVSPLLNLQPKLTADTSAKTILLKYDAVPAYYGLAWQGKSSVVREIKNDELDIFFRYKAQDHVSTVLNGNNKGDYCDVFIRPVVLPPKSETTLRGLLATGSEDTVKKRLGELEIVTASVAAQKKIVSDPLAGILPQGQKYVLSQKLLRSTVLSDIVYPVYTQGHYIRHFTPGKWWDSLYTWDSGFTALGLSEINPDLALQCVNAYTTPPGSQSAFIHHGSPVPTQMYAFLELWQKTQSPTMLAYLYPRLHQYYEFLSGNTEGSTTQNLNSHLIRTWDYFYNSGGWDDYPAQVAVHQQGLEQSVTPVISTAQCIRVAKILRMAARQLNMTDDVAQYDRDIALFSDALQKYSWDESAGYFSYVRHDKDNNPIGHFQEAKGQDYNMGLDGVAPLVSGICTPHQESLLLDKIFSEKHLWTPSGIGAVDQSAPYYREDGYWNGAVWMPHQWFLWKTMLDLGRSDLAFQIAKKGLDVYSGEANETYQTYEHFLAKTGRGAGWHQFSGLSTPVLSWFSAYYKPGTITTGFEIWIQKQSFKPHFSGFQADIAFDTATPAHPRDLVACLNPAYHYTATFHGQKIPTQTLYPGLLNIHVPATNQSGTLVIQISDTHN